MATHWTIFPVLEYVAFTLCTPATVIFGDQVPVVCVTALTCWVTAPDGTRAFGIEPDVKFDAFKFDKSTCCVTEEDDSRASANVPLVIFDVAKSGTSLADNDNLAEGTVPEVRLDALRLDRSTC